VVERKHEMESKKLYSVTLTIMVMAKDENSALDVAHLAWSSDDICRGWCETEEVYYDYSVSDGWADEIPFGSDDNKTCEEIIEEINYEVFSVAN